MYLKKKEVEIQNLKKEISALEAHLKILIDKENKIKKRIEDLSSHSFETSFEVFMKNKFLQQLYEQLGQLQIEIENLELKIYDKKAKLKELIAEKKVMETFKQRKEKMKIKEDEKRENELLDEIVNHSNRID